MKDLFVLIACAELILAPTSPALLPLTEQRIALLLHELDAIGPDDAPRGGFVAGVDFQIDRMRGWWHPLMVLPDHPIATKS